MPDLKSVGVQTFPVDAGFCSAEASFLWAFAVNTWERQESLVPVVHNVYLDTNQDGIYDYVVFNFDLSFSGALSDGRNVTWSVDLATGDATAFFFTEHNFNSGNTVLTICGEQIGQNAANFFQPMTVDALAIEWYFQGVVSDAITGMEIAPLGERYLGFPEDIAPFGSGVIDVLDFGPVGTNPSESGLLVIATSASGAKTEAFTLRIRPDRPKRSGDPH